MHVETISFRAFDTTSLSSSFRRTGGADIYSLEEQRELLGVLAEQRGFDDFRKQARAAVDESGVLVVDGVDTDSEPLLVALAAIFGEVDAEGNGFPGRTISEIRHDPEEENGLFSAENERFAPHTDSCFMAEPHRYLVMGVVIHDPDRHGETTLVDGYEVLRGLTEDEERRLHQLRVQFSVNGDAESAALAAPVLANHRERTMIRYRSDMIVRDVSGGEADEESLRALRKFEDLAAEHPEISRTFLERGSVIIVDNWRMLHGRDHFPKGSPRLLKRLKVKFTGGE